MPLDITVTLENGKTKKFYIPLDIMRGEKKEDGYFNDFKIQKPWNWVNKNYILNLGENTNMIKVQIDISGRMADVNPSDNNFPRPTFADEDPTK